MAQTADKNRRFVLAKRPQGMPTREDISLEEVAVPAPGKGEVLLRTLFLSLDPYMRGRMSDAKSYSAPIAIGEVIVGGTVSRVESSQHPDYQPGDLVVADSGWQDYSLSNGEGLAEAGEKHVSPFLGAGATRHAGLYRLHGADGYR